MSRAVSWLKFREKLDLDADPCPVYKRLQKCSCDGVSVISGCKLIRGITVAFYAPQRHGYLKVVDNKYCTSKRGGARCLAILNMIFAIIFGLLALFLGSSLLTLGSSCSLPLFWCYEVSSWSLVILYGATTILLRRTAGYNS